MNLNWFESFLYGLFSGLADILPISAEAHRILMLKFFGNTDHQALIRLFAHLGVAAALYLNCRQQLVRIRRARALKQIPKRRRRRPLDTRSLMDLSLLVTMLVPVALMLLLKTRRGDGEVKLIWVAVAFLINGVVLYIPQFFPTANRDSRTLSRVQGLLMGLGGGLGLYPGLSSTGLALSASSVCGVERSYGLSMVLLMDLGMNIGLLAMDIVACFTAGVGTFGFLILVRYLFTAMVAFAGAYTGVKIMRALNATGYSIFAFYCWAMALFTFILNLMA